MAYWSLSRASCAAETHTKVPEKKNITAPNKAKTTKQQKD